MSQPVDQLYPNPVIREPNSSHSSNGSFGPVFIVLAVILVISVVSCVLGRLCSRRHNRVKEVRHHSMEARHHSMEAHHHQHGHHEKTNNHREEAHHHRNHHEKAESHSLGPREWESREKPSFKLRERGDIEFGFDKRIPSAKVANNNGEGMVRPPHFDNGGGNKPGVRFADNV